MIFTQNGVLAKEYQVVNGGTDFQHLVYTTEHPATAENMTPEQLEAYKRTRAPYAVYGLADGTGRADSEVTARTILFLDVDDATTDYDAVVGMLTSGVVNRYNFVAYPTISNSVKPGARLRVGVELDRPATQDEYVKVWRVLGFALHVHGDEAGVTRQFKQLQGNYVRTSQNAHRQPLFNVTDTDPLPVDLFVQTYDSNPDQFSVATAHRGKQDLRVDNASGIPRYAKTNKQLLMAILDPEQYYTLFGGWDNMLTSVGGWVYRQTYGDVGFTANVVEFVNSLGSEPIATKELSDKFKSWVRNWRY
ncbi:hypothetical protein K1728_09985 [Weissella confusa]|uniref:hypothetical protein n=1 Tax=Weissella confusa TaxID=1583 RepID=UPI001C6F847C|nr:hypothetical protein [Weissella confusa]QYU57475.1 hypothetical protein K1728_09985 [Weissella confusa]